MASGIIPIQASHDWKMTRKQYTVECTTASSDAPNVYYGSTQLYGTADFPDANTVFAIVLGARISGKSYICYAGIQHSATSYTLRATAPISATVTVQVLFIYA